MFKHWLSHCFCCVILICTMLSSCAFIHTQVESIDKSKFQETQDLAIQSPAKAHLLDGSVVVFAKGFQLRNNILRGNGLKYDLLRQKQTAVSEIPVDSVASLEYYKKKWQPAATLACTSSIVFIIVIGIAFMSLPSDW